MQEINVREWFKTLFWVVLIVLGITAIPAVSKLGNSFNPSKTINVSADGKATVPPDIANISFSVVSEGSSPEKIQVDNAKEMSVAIDFVKNQGVDSKDIKTANYNLSPRYEYDESRHKSNISGYTLTQTTLVKIRDLNKVGKVLGGLSELGVNQISSVSFDIEDQDKYLAGARNVAFEKASAKAKEMAAKNGVRIKRVLTFSEYRGGGPIYPYPYGGEARSTGISGDYILPSPPIEPGTQEVTVQVNVTYEIE
ncbi:MAG: SIMPL domain-containing protein [Candidatus Colwellbacteria bacterium]|nr:SIMPL domain-containing protein [Candidatus Colwellbacteria bacterium]